LKYVKVPKSLDPTVEAYLWLTTHVWNLFVLTDKA
jgi:hypothetical protein